MEIWRPLSSNNGLKHRSLSLLRILRGLICLVIFLSSAFTFLVYLGPLAAGLMRLFSIHYSRRTTSFIFGLWLALWPFLFEKINKTKFIFSGETVPEDQRVLLIANHRTEVDWMYFWDLAMRKGCLGYIKYILKSSLMKLPVLGWGFHLLEFISVERNWEVDEPILRQKLSTFINPADPLWLAVFPEGTDFTEEKCKRSQKFAAENGLPVLKNVLLPKTKGFCACLEVLRGSLDAEVHMHVRRIPVNEIPEAESEAAAWLIHTFQIKDQLLSNFNYHGHFPNQGTEGEVSIMKYLANFSIVIALTGIFTFLTFFSSIWFKIHVSLVCAYIASTFFDIRPLTFLGFSNKASRKQNE
ncbi:hypothetical protein PVL29_023897 [Vitis rotundifolia]|uniref:1-acylglycerol-3-phosphate O-acyltransferase n=1 Tax=Vitis rotundifolia TaxID=103349 RepID=A0AA38YQD9_VITRO|nr:hypothetical protein PVL29_023897 [Vitis rotundifolia]